jgi:sulfite exporter TauE/SafE
MNVFSELLALCHAGLDAAAGTPLSLPVSLFLMAIAGSLVHCSAMCGPFVLGQVVADAETVPASGYGEWRRLAGAALLPYHLGRATTYIALGALGGAITSVFIATTAFGWLAGVLLLVAAALMVAQAFGYAASVDSPLTAGLARLAGPLANARSSAARYALGVVLGFLPCGLLYGALAGAAGTSSPAWGAIAMAAFSAGTMPALVVVGWAGALARHRLKEAARWVTAPLLLANAAVMTALAIQRF